MDPCQLEKDHIYGKHMHNQTPQNKGYTTQITLHVSN